MAQAAVLDPLALGPLSGSPGQRRERRTGSRKEWRRSLPSAPSPAPELRPWETPAPRRLGLLDLLAWAYRDQKVHRYLRRPEDWFLFALDYSRELGADAPRARVHRDAALVHAAVMELGTDAAHLIFQCAELGDWPERSTAAPMPYPTEPPNRKDYDYCIGAVGGRKQYVLLVTAEIVTEIEEEWARDGRTKRMRLVAKRRVRHPVKYCPIDWRPDPSFVRMVNQIADRFDAAIAALRKTLAGVDLVAHVIDEGA
jgi:hypothetical protein